MNILILGSGGRESAFAWKISQSQHTEKLYIAPGNAGTAEYGENIKLSLLDFEGIAQFALENSITMIVVGPEEPLVKGIHDYFLSREDLKSIAIIGPQKAGALLEGSKDFSKQFMQRHQIPTASSKTFTKETLQEGLDYLDRHFLPIVLKADGLAAGKGVLICTSNQEAKREFIAMLTESKFGDAGDTVVVEEFLSGIELSVFVLTDGESYKILPSAKDYKRIGVSDTGLNTGGMGSISPVPFATDAFLQKVEEQIIIPTMEGLKKENIPYKGFIFLGLMNVEENPYLIEYNVRMGDPETESVVPRIESDLVDLLMGVADGNLHEKSYSISPKTAATVMLVSGGYPGDYEKGKVITGIENVKESMIFQAGTIQDGEDIKTNGGRVLAVTALEDTLFDALQQATADSGRIFYQGRYFRTDIGFDLMDYIKNK
jgi:phosphoribosylamine--glycine ligase